MFRRMIAVVVAFAALAVAPVANAAERPPKIDFNGAFELGATNGFHVLGLVASFEGKAQVSIFVSRAGEAAIYTTRGLGTTNSVEVDFGALGRVDLEVVPTGKEETISSKCGGKGKTVTLPGSEFVGTVEFHGEEGFTEFSATHLPMRLDALARLICASPIGIGTTSGSHAGGVLLRARTANSPSLMVQQNHPAVPIAGPSFKATITHAHRTETRE